MDYTLMSKEELIRELGALAGKIQSLKEHKNNGYAVPIEESADAILISDPRGFYLDANKKACEMLGFAKSEIQGKHVSDFLPKEELEKNPLRLDEVNAGKTVVMERRIRRKDGSIVHVEVSAKSLGDGK